MKRLALITVINKSATWLQFLLLVMHLLNVSTLPQGPSTDPCDASPCGKGAECKPMGSIAICVCPNNNDKGDPFVACMKVAEEAELVKPSSSAFPATAISSNPADVHQFAASSASFDIASVPQPRASSDSVTTSKPTPRPSSTMTTQRVSLITSRPTPPPSTTTTTRNPYVHVYQTTSERAPTTSSGHGYSYNNNPQNSNSHGDDNNNPDSHRIPIISNSNDNNNNAFPRHEYPPRPINGGSTSSPGFSSYHNGGGGSSSSGGSYDIFNEKTVGPIAGSDYGSTSSYHYRGSSGHLSGTQGAYEYDSRPILGPSRPTPTMGYHSINRFGHHNYHPSSSGFPDPITESSSNSRFASSGTGTTYDIYNYNPVRNDILGSSSDGSYSRIADPLGKYENCRMVNGIVVCADDTNSFPHNHHQYHDHRHHPNSQYPNHHRGDVITTTSNYGFHSTRDRDHYSSYYPSRYSSAPPTMTSDRYYYNSYLDKQGYPEHGPRHPIDSEASSTYGRHPFLPKEQKISTQTVLTISSSSSGTTTTSRNDNDHPMCQSMCGINSVCRLVLDRPVCGCAIGHTGDPSVRCNPIYSERGQRRDTDSCERHVECKETEICAKNRCIDPCKNQSEIIGGSSSVKIDSQFKTSICGTNAECLVVGHTPVCKCNKDFFGNPYVACVA